MLSYPLVQGLGLFGLYECEYHVRCKGQPEKIYSQNCDQEVIFPRSYNVALPEGATKADFW